MLAQVSPSEWFHQGDHPDGAYTLVTCTGDRLLAFMVCIEYDARMMEGVSCSVKEWIIVDDGKYAYDLSVYEECCTLGCNVRVIRRDPSADAAGQHTLAANLQQALPRCTPDTWVIFIEDDDWYSSFYLLNIIGIRVSADPTLQLIGQSHAKYYRICAREYRQLQNSEHASLCATACSGALIPLILDICKSAIDPFIDLHLWRTTRCVKSLTPHGYVIGIKQMPGRSGTTLGWRDKKNGFSPDLCSAILRTWVGDEDASRYNEIAQTKVNYGTN